MSKFQYTGDQSKLKTPYIPSEPLKEAVNVAIALGRPLLLKGEPGCGKTRLAKAVAEELDLPFFEWPVKSTSRAQDGLYTYDTIGRLRDAQLVATQDMAAEEKKALRQKFDNPANYINWGPLGKAFQKEFLNGKPSSVVLIDEIDKADIDFPNDLLHELDQNAFTVRETNPTTEVQADVEQKPIIFITSNDEKELPDAFLRRCLFFYIKFPPEEILNQIVSVHMAHRRQEQSKEYDSFAQEVVNRFWQLREQMVKDKPHGGKKISTSELLDWIKVLTQEYYNEGKKLPPIDQELLFPSVLLKNLTDYVRYSNQLSDS